MKTKLIEASHGGTGNWGKFMVARFDEEEWARRSSVMEKDVAPELKLSVSLLRARGWGPQHILVFDLETGEGGMFLPGGMAKADLNKHKIWVYPLFEPFLTWLYLQDLSDLDKLPEYVKLSNAEFAMAGYRRKGPHGD